MRILLMTLIMFLPFCANANGWMVESQSLGAKDLASGLPLKLVEEDLLIRLEDTKYDAEVEYTVEKRGRYGSFDGDMFFPVLCIEPWEENEGADIPCVYTFEATVGGEAVSYHEAEIKNIGYLLDGYDEVLEAGNVVALNYSHEGMPNEINPSRVSLRLYRFPVKHEIFPLKIKIRYSAPYYFYWSGFSKNSFYYFSNDLVFYDFSPAAKWANGNLSKFRVTVDASKVFGDVIFENQQNFSIENRKYVFEKSDFDLGEMKPMIFGVERRYEKQYKAHMRSIEHIGVTWSLAADKQLEKYPIENAKDGDLATAWCATSKKARIEIKIPKAEKNVYCGFEGIALVNGYTKSEAIFKANRRIMRGKITVSGEGGPVSYEQEFTLNDYDFTKSWNPYLGIRYFSSGNRNENFKPLMAKAVGGIEERVSSQSDIDVVIQIDDVYSGEQYEDLCVSEIYPLFNC